MTDLAQSSTGPGRTAEALTTTVRVPQLRLSVSEHRKLARRYRLKRALTAYLFLAPNLIFFSIFMIIPVFWVFWLSFQEGGLLGTMRFSGLSNWQGVFSDPLALQSLVNSGKYALIAIPGMLVLGMIVALFMENLKRGDALLRAAIYFPVLAPIVVAGLIWIFMVHPDFGALNLIVRAFSGAPLNFLGNKALALPTVAAVEIWRGIGFWAVFFLAALSGLPAELYEAARLDGTSGWQRFRHLTLPLLRPNILFALVIATIYNLQIFDTVFIMTNGGPGNSTATVVWYIYRTLFTYGNVGYGAALSFVLLLVILLLTLVQMRLLRGRRAS